MPSNRACEPPDGGYGWIVLACCGLCMSTVLALGRTHGIVLVEVIELYDVNRTQVFLIMVMHRVFSFAFAPVIGKLMTKFDYSVMLCAGCLLISFSLILSSFTASYWQIVITYGCMQGLGTNFVVSACNLTIGQYFTKRRSLAMGIMYAIAGVNGLISPILFNWLLGIFHFHGVLLITGALILHPCALSMLVRQPNWYRDKHEQKSEVLELAIKNSERKVVVVNGTDTSKNKGSDGEIKYVQVNGNDEAKDVHVEDDCDDATKDVHVDDETKDVHVDDETKDVHVDDETKDVHVDDATKDSRIHLNLNDACVEEGNERNRLCVLPNQDGEKASEKKDSAVMRLLKEIREDLKLFKDGIFLLMVFNRTFVMITVTYFLVLLPDFVEVEIKPHITKKEVAYLLSMASIGGVLIRLAIGWILDKLPWPKKYSMAGISLCMGVTVFVFQFSTVYTHLVLGSVFFGLWTGMIVVVQYVVEIELMGRRRVHMANGLTRFVAGASNAIAGVLIGYLRDELGSYKVCLSLLGGSAILSGLVWIFEPLVVKCCPPELTDEQLLSLAKKKKLEKS